MSKTAEKYKTYYESGWYTTTMLAKLVAKGAITQEEYNEIAEDET